MKFRDFIKDFIKGITKKIKEGFRGKIKVKIFACS